MKDSVPRKAVGDELTYTSIKGDFVAVELSAQSAGTTVRQRGFTFRLKLDNIWENLLQPQSVVFQGG